MLSPQSVVSEHVLRELSLAVEKRKRILPVKLMATELPASFEYSLAGLQRVAISDFEGILRAHKNGVERVKIRDERKSLMILPLEDLSPATEDNSWFADGLTGELISALSNIKSLRIPDRKTSMDLKGFRGKTSEIARELDVRYFVEGNVRKFGDEIKISVELLDIDTGDYLWQHSYRGEFKDIFDMQEAVAREVVIGLKLHLTPDEQEKVKDRGTENAEAYELFVKAREYADRNTKEDILLSIQLATTAIELDPLYANAYGFKANSLAALYRAYDRNPVLLAEAETLAQEALRIKPDLYYTYGALSMIYMLQGNHAKAEAMGQTYVQNDPLNYYSHGALGFFYYNTGQPAKAIALWEEAVRLKPDYLAGLWGCAIANQAAGEEEKYAEAATRAIPYFERYIKLHPDDETPRVQHAFLLFG
ncbi:MAG TPA: tetratricopeptide repeat protein, partial [Candidatus Kapabacteria bacterium]|nr:tetratricopeptide repeat protein [Candidatus Kapabacteria bacterium]